MPRGWRRLLPPLLEPRQPKLTGATSSKKGAGLGEIGSLPLFEERRDASPLFESGRMETGWNRKGSVISQPEHVGH